MFKFLNLEISAASRRGEVLMESLIAITVVVIGLLGMFSLLSRSVSLTRVVADRYVAAGLAAEGIEVVKNLVDHNVLTRKPWNLGLDTGAYEVVYNSVVLEPFTNKTLFFDNASGLYSYQSSGVPTHFLRKVIVERIAADELKVNSIVSWTTRGGATFETNVEDHFLNSR